MLQDFRLDLLMQFINYVMQMFSPFVRVPAIIKVHGAHLKASAAMVRLRLYDILALLPPKTYEGNTCMPSSFYQ